MGVAVSSSCNLRFVLRSSEENRVVALAIATTATEFQRFWRTTGIPGTALSPGVPLGAGTLVISALTCTTNWPLTSWILWQSILTPTST